VAIQFDPEDAVNVQALTNVQGRAVNRAVHDNLASGERSWPLMASAKRRSGRSRYWSTGGA
jgi:hypothetical protein